MKRKAKIAGKSRARGAASAAHPRAAAGEKTSMRQMAVHPSAAADRPSGVAAPVRAPSPEEDEAEREFREWIRRYGPVERAVYAERERREASRRRRALERRRAFGASSAKRSCALCLAAPPRIIPLLSGGV